jgi:hypothetical protein
MSYIQDNLMPNEKILFSARVHAAVFLPAVVLLIMTNGLFIYGLKNAVQVVQPGSPPPVPTATVLIGSFMMFLSGILFLYSILLGLQALVVMFTTEFAVTNRRVIAKRGFIRRHTLEILLSKVESVAVHQNVLGRLLNFGTVTVTGTGGTRESFRAIMEPVVVRKKINQIIEGYMQAYAQFQQRKAS